MEGEDVVKNVDGRTLSNSCPRRGIKYLAEKANQTMGNTPVPDWREPDNAAFQVPMRCVCGTVNVVCLAGRNDPGDRGILLRQCVLPRTNALRACAMYLQLCVGSPGPNGARGHLPIHGFDAIHSVPRSYDVTNMGTLPLLPHLHSDRGWRSRVIAQTKKITTTSEAMSHGIPSSVSSTLSTAFSSFSTTNRSCTYSPPRRLPFELRCVQAGSCASKCLG